ncbi:hypothetical protein [Salinicoccus sp. CNSTN-B1]
MIKKILSKPIDWVVYSLFNENQRKQIGDMLTQTQKDTVIRLLNGKKFTERRRVKSLKHHLYTLGFTERALDDMQTLRDETDNPEIKRLISWEMSLWHANRNDAVGAQRALDYLDDAYSKEDGPTRSGGSPSSKPSVWTAPVRGKQPYGSCQTISRHSRIRTYALVWPTLNRTSADAWC